MPALSPTMTEGYIAGWKVRDGQAFGAGDVLLEIETDKATMDVEAQDDGVMMKILAREGSKAVQVGSRIAVIADAGDDVSALEMPPDESPQPQKTAQGQAAPPPSQPPPPPTTTTPTTNRSGAERAPAPAPGREPKYPLMPAVAHLFKQHGLSAHDVAAIPPTGPGGRLLKGDVLAFVGSIGRDAPGAVSSRFERLSHLDLSNVKVAASEPAAAPAKRADPPTPAPQPLSIEVPVSLAKAVEVQAKIRRALGVFLPLSTFTSRAVAVANDDLPRVPRKPSPDDLFDQVLGLDRVKAAAPGGSHGVYMPRIAALPRASMLARPPRPPPAKSVDVIDELAGPGRRRPSSLEVAAPPMADLSSGVNLFTLVVPRGGAAGSSVLGALQADFGRGTGTAGPVTLKQLC